MPLPLANYLIFSIMFILLTWAVYLPYRAGQLYMGIIYTMAAAAYFSAYAATAWEWPVWLAFASSPVIGGIFAFIPALGLRKAPGFTTAIASLALVFILQTVIKNLDFLGGQSGYFGIPMANGLLYISAGVLVLAGVFVHRFDHSVLGRAAETILYNRDVAAAFGVSIEKMNILLQTVSGALSGLAGAIFAFNIGALFPAAFGFSILLNVMVMLFIGGTFTMWGPALFAPILWGFPLILPEFIAEWKDVIYGSFLIMILIFRPEGVITKQTIRRIRMCFLNVDARLRQDAS